MKKKQNDTEPTSPRLKELKKEFEDLQKAKKYLEAEKIKLKLDEEKVKKKIEKEKQIIVLRKKIEKLKHKKM